MPRCLSDRGPAGARKVQCSYQESSHSSRSFFDRETGQLVALSGKVGCDGAWQVQDARSDWMENRQWENKRREVKALERSFDGQSANSLGRTPKAKRLTCRVAEDTRIDRKVQPQGHHDEHLHGRVRSGDSDRLRFLLVTLRIARL
eukprot:115384-Hanusia_phi.AAC.1